MGYFDDAFGKAVPGGNLTKPLMIAAGLLLASKMFGKGPFANQPAGQSPGPGQVPNAPHDQDEAGGLLGGLGGLLDRLRSAGAGPQADSWVGTGPNQPVQPRQVEAAIGEDRLAEIARQAGMSKEELLDQLSANLPNIVDRLTPQGRMPTADEVRRGYRA